MGDEVAAAIPELVGLLSDPKAEVRTGAGELVLSFSTENYFIEYVKEHPKKVLRALCRIAEDPDEPKLSMMGVSALVNLSSVNDLAEALIGIRAPVRMFEIANAAIRAGTEHWERASRCLMLISNLTRTAEGRKDFLESDGAKQRFAFLCSLYLFFNQTNYAALAKGEIVGAAKKAEGDESDGEQEELMEKNKDQFGYVGTILVNFTFDEKGRALLTYDRPEEYEKSDILSRLADQMIQRQRRLPVLSIFRNLLLDEDTAGFVGLCDFLPRMACFLYPSNALYDLEGDDLKRAEERQKDLNPMIMEKGNTMTTNKGVRERAADCCYIMVQTRQGRDTMREQTYYEVLRSWHLQEPDDDIRTVIENTIPGLVLEEHEIEADQARMKEENRIQEVKDEEGENPAVPVEISGMD